MAAGSPELRLGISFDLQSFKTVALPSLVQAASNFVLPIKIQFGRASINEEMRLLGRQLGQRKYRIDLNDASIKSAIANADKLAAKLSGIRGTTEKARALGSVVSTSPGAGGPSAPQVQSIFEAAKGLNIVQGAANRARTQLEAELKTGFATAGAEALDGLIQGILKGEGKLKEVSTSLGEKLLKSLKQALEIQSPSRAMFRIGQQAGQGFNDGLIASLQEATRNAVAMMDASLRRLDRIVELRQRKARAIAPGQPGFEMAQRQAGAAMGQRERVQNRAESLQLRGAAEQFEGGSYQALSKLLQSLQIEASEIKPNTPEWNNLQERIARVNIDLQKAGRLAEEIQMRENLGAYDPASLASLESRLVILKNRAREIAPDTSEWKALNQEIQRAERLTEKASRKPVTRGQRLGAAGGAFLYGGGMGGGVGSALGGVAGGLMGGVPGAFTGAAIGQVTDSILASVSAMTTQASALMQMQRGLAMASVDAKDFAEAQATVGSMSQRLLMPLEQTTRLFTQLRVNTKQYNLSVQETARIMEGTALAIMATGGSSEDLEGAMRAVVQIMSKGGVQAEELRGQLGERFPGAVVKFAQANKLSFEELQQGLEQGKIGIKEFVAFAEKNYTDYAGFSKQLATAPEFAGRRLQIALEELSREVGALFAPIGAEIQDALTGAIKEVAKFITENRAYLRQFISDWASIIGPIVKVLGQLLGVVAKFALEVGKIFQSLFSQIRQAVGMATIGEAKARLDKAKAATKGMTRPTGNVRGGGAFQELDQAQQAFAALGGNAAWKQANAPLTPSNLTFGGAGAGMSLDRLGKPERRRTARAGKTRESRVAELTEELRLAKELLSIDQQITVADLGGNQLAVIRLNGIKEQLRIQSEIAKVRLDQDVPAAEKQLQIEKLRLDAEKERLTTNSEIQKQIQTELQGIQDAMIGIATTAKTELEDRQEYFRLVKNGLSPAIAQITVETQRQFATEMAKLAMLEKQTLAEISILDAKKNQTNNDEEQLKILRDRLALIQGGIAESPALAQATIQSRTQKQLLEDQPQDATGFLTEASTEAQKELAKLTNWGFQAVEGAKAIGSAFGQAFKDIASGSMSAQEALANMMQSIADHFLDMAAQIIAQQITMMIYGIILKALGVMGGAASGLSGAGALTPGAGATASLPTSYAGVTGGTAGLGSIGAGGGFGSFSMFGFANGGIVTGPTLGLVGEGKYNEAIVPLPDGRSIPVQMQGESIRDKMGSDMAGAGASPMLSMSFQTTTINGVEYVDRAQLEAAMAETRRISVREGATRGATIALDKLANSPSSRRRVGLR